MFSYFGNCNSPWESLILFEAAKEGLIPTVVHRLTDYERKNIVSGAIFIWDERRSSIRRWTDGIPWSNSRVVGDFLEYRELLPESKSDSRPCRFTVKPYGLCKRTLYLVSSDDPAESKLRLIAYYSKRDALDGKLPLPSQNPDFKDIVERLEKRYGPNRLRQNGALTSTGVMLRNPSPNRERRKKRDQKSAMNSALQPPSTTSHLDHHSSERLKPESGNIAITISLPENNRGSYSLPSIADSKSEGVTRAPPEVHVPGGDARAVADAQTSFNPVIAASLPGFDQLLKSSLQARLNSIVEGPPPPTLPFLPQPPVVSRFESQNSEDRRQLGILDNCGKAPF